MNLKEFFEELKRRNVIRETLVYILIAWVILQVASIILPIFNAPQWILQTLTLALIIGIPIIIIASWVYQLTDKGLQRMTELNSSTSNLNQKRRLNLIILIATVVAIGLFFAIGKKVKSYNEAPPYSIAILPFKDLSLEQKNEWFTEGLREDI